MEVTGALIKIVSVASIAGADGLLGPYSRKGGDM